MKLSNSQIIEYKEQGLVFLGPLFTSKEIDIIKNEINALIDKKVAGLVLESDNKTLRALHGCHLYSKLFNNLIRLQRLVEPSKQIIGSEIYLYQFKINTKPSFTGDFWPWHQDYSFWKKEDGMPESRAVSIAIFLDDVNEFNGPISFIPKSHNLGLLDIEQVYEGKFGLREWQQNVSADLKYTIPNQVIEDLVKSSGIIAPKGEAGSALIFHGCAIHGSGRNISPMNRTILIITYNSVDNKLPNVGDRRPEFLVSRDYQKMEVLPNEMVFGNEV